MPDIGRSYTRGLASLLGNGNPQATEDALFQRMAGDIDRTSGDAARSINENTFGRGLGLSTISRDMQADRERLREDALLKARKDSFLASQQATLAALAQAATQQAREQQGNQFNQSMDMQRRNISSQRDIANNQMLAQGGGLLGGALMQLGGKTFAPEIRGGLRSLFGADKQGGAPVTAGETAAPDATVNIGSDYAPTVGDLPMADFEIPDFDINEDYAAMPDLGGLDALAGFDPFAGYDPYNAYDYDYWSQ